MNRVFLEELIKHLPSIKSDRNYWFVRSMGGEFYDEFVERNFIAIGPNYITLKDIEDSIKNETKDKPASSNLADIILKKDKSAKYPYAAAGNLLRFVRDIKKGDIILIPSTGSLEITIGEILDDNAFTVTETQECPLYKRRKVNWVKTSSKRALDPIIWPLFNSQRALNNANTYSSYIDSELNSFYIKDNNAHYVMDFTTTEPIKGKTLFTFGQDLLYFGDEISNDLELENDASDFDIKIDLKSPGSVELIGLAMVGILALSALTVALAGGKIKFNNKIWGVDTDADVESPGFLESLTNFLNAKAERKNKALELQHKLNQMGYKKSENDDDILDV